MSAKNQAKRTQLQFNFDTFIDEVEEISTIPEKETAPSLVQETEKSKKPNKVVEENSDINIKEVLDNLKKGKRKTEERTINDWGDVLHDSKKYKYSGIKGRSSITLDDAKQMNQVEIAKNVKRNAIWKKKTYKKMQEEGYSPYIAALTEELRSAIPPSPFTAKDIKNIDEMSEAYKIETIQAYVNFTSFMKDICEEVKEAETLEEAQTYLKEQLIDEYVRKVAERNGRVVWALTEAGNKASSFGLYDPHKQKATELSKKEAIFDTLFNPHLENANGTYNKEWEELLGKKKLTNKTDKKESLTDLIRRATYLSNTVRKGVEYREGKDASVEELGETFGLRSIDFGNQYKTDEERQTLLNHAYDSFMDLANALKIDPTNIGFNKSLALALGSRGKGGKNAPAAHYEAGGVIINLTKKAGSGTLAHEWFHALDNWMGSKMISLEHRATLKYASEDFNLEDANYEDYRLEKKYKHLSEPMLEALSAFEDTRKSLIYNGARDMISKGLNSTLTSSINKYEEYKNKSRRGSQFKKDRYQRWYVRELTSIGGFTKLFADSVKADESRTKPYWQKSIEIMARAFEVYIIDKLEEKNERNDNLVSYRKGNEDIFKDITNVSKKLIEHIESVYPMGEERIKAKQYFNLLMEKLRESGLFKKQEQKEKTEIVASHSIRGREVMIIRDNEITDSNMKYAVVEKNIKGEIFNALPSDMSRGTLKVAENAMYSRLGKIAEEEQGQDKDQGQSQGQDVKTTKKNKGRAI